jgi:hypothetical protein
MSFGMATKKADLDVEIGRLYRRPLDEFISARNDLAKQLRKLGLPKDAEQVRTLAKPTPSAWAVNQLFERAPEKMERLLGTGRRALAAQHEAISGRGVSSLREHIEAGRTLTEELRRRAVEILAESGRAVSRTLSDRIGTNLQALALSPAAAEEASRGWISRDLDPPGFEVLAGLQVASSPVVDLAARRAEREAKRAKPERERKEETPAEEPPAEKPPKKSARDNAREERERQRQETVEKARREAEEEKIRRRVEVAQGKLNRARDEAEALRKETERLERLAAEARRKAEEATLAASRARDRSDRAAERLARAEEALQEARQG